MFERFFQKAPDEAEAQRLMVLLTQSPAMHQLEAEREQARLSKVRELSQRRAELKRQHDDAMPSLRAATLKAKAREQECREKLQKAIQETARCVNAEVTASSGFKSQLDAIDAEIIKLAPPVIDECRRDLLRLFDETRFQTQEQTSAPHWFTGKRTTVTNTQTLEARLAAIRAALVKVDALRLEPLSLQEVAQRLEHLRRGVLEIDDVDDERAAS